MASIGKHISNYTEQKTPPPRPPKPPRHNGIALGDRVRIAPQTKRLSFCWGTAGTVRRILRDTGNTQHMYFFIDLDNSSLVQKIDWGICPTAQYEEKGLVACRTGDIEWLPSGPPTNAMTALLYHGIIEYGSVVKLSCLPERLWYCENHIGDVRAITYVHGRGVVYGVELRNPSVAHMYRRSEAGSRGVVHYEPQWVQCTRGEIQLYDFERACIIEPAREHAAA
tara:strand:- start:2019 stop:2690 length:672 start_codon:yes stop_codon:yes gene_type:complete